MRQLATIQTITSLSPIEGADKIEVAQILGWQVVVGKGEFKVGDKVVYCEVDSILPERSEFEFLRERKFRIRTIKLRKQVSQGIVFPLSILKKRERDYSVGQDVTEELGIKKYDPQGDLERKLVEEQATRQKNKIKKFFSRFSWFRRLFPPARLSFPPFIKKTDEDRIQLFPNICEEQKNTLFTATEKLDGQSATYFLIRKKSLFGTKFQFGVCSRNFLLPKPDKSTYWTIAQKLDIESLLKQLIGDDEYIVLQGEIVGAGVQGNKYGLKELDFYAFNLIRPDFQYGYPSMKFFLGGYVQCVPLVGDALLLPASTPNCVEMAKGKSVIADVLREGMVLRGNGLSFKIVNPDFLLKYGE